MAHVGEDTVGGEGAVDVHTHRQTLESELIELIPENLRAGGSVEDI